MNNQLHGRLCANLRNRRWVPFAVFHNLLLSTICVCLACSTHVEQPVACPAIEFSAVADAQSDSTKPVTLNDGTTVQVSRTPLLMSADITGGSASSTAGEWVVNVDMTGEGAKRLDAFSKQNVGRKMAVLVDGKVHGGTPRVAGPITAKGFQIDGFQRADAEQLATALNAGCKR
jgi:preprotein translocase subunit SecD